MNKLIVELKQEELKNIYGGESIWYYDGVKWVLRPAVLNGAG